LEGRGGGCSCASATHLCMLTLAWESSSLKPESHRHAHDPAVVHILWAGFKLTAQELHCVSCSGVQVACCNWPTPHVEHLSQRESRTGEQTLANCPDGQDGVEQGLHEHAVQPSSAPQLSALYVPALQGAHSWQTPLTLRPHPINSLPFGQEIIEHDPHSMAPNSEAYVPAGHRAHLAKSPVLSLYVPGLHASQLPSLVPAQPTLSLPAGQATHATHSPSMPEEHLLLYSFSAQGRQLMHSSRFAVAYEPVGHS
jgi:hypothetical protein